MRLNQVGVLFTLASLAACSAVRVEKVPATSSTANPFLPTTSKQIAVIAASGDQCAAGGVVIVNYLDGNQDEVFNEGETVLSSQPICNGAQGSTGASGAGAGILVGSALPAACPAGGAVFTTFIDGNNNGVLDNAETVSSVSTLCNGVAGENGNNGANGQSERITLTAATLSQCPSGGIVYSTALEGGPVNQSAVVCNGSNGNDANFLMGAVGPAVAGKSYSACHHDYLYIPNSQEGSRGWLTFRHQSNGANDQGIGSTGFQIWNVDIANFALNSEVGGVPYCSLQWDPVTRILNYTVVDNSDGLAGTHGEIRF